MLYNIVTLFPEFFSGPLDCGLMGRAAQKGLVEFRLHNPRDQATDRHKTVDDRPYGGGPGMVMLPEPLAACLRSFEPGRLIYLTPKGRPLTQELARSLAQESAITLVCGRYEGIDARLEEIFPLEGISIGDFVLNGGESAALSLIEATARLLPGFMGHEESGTEESFSSALLEYPHYTRPEVFEGLEVPPVLRSGDHKRIAEWRRQEALKATLLLRPDLLPSAGLSRQDLEFLRQIPRNRLGRNMFCCLVHYPVLDKDKKTVAVSLTNLDIHDIARSSYSYGLGGFFIVTPLKDQLALLDNLLEHWIGGSGGRHNPDRGEALSIVRGVLTLEECIDQVRSQTGQEPLIAATSAQGAGDTTYAALALALTTRPVLLLFGTSHGLAEEALDRCAASLPPLRRLTAYNHLSVRAAAAITLDRILGDER